MNAFTKKKKQNKKHINEVKDVLINSVGESFTTNTSNHHTVFLNILQFDFKLYVKKR